MVKPHCCVLCKAEASLMCKRCRDFYCSVNCQLLDWPDHKAVCIQLPSLTPINPLSAQFASIVFKPEAKSIKDDGMSALSLTIADSALMGAPRPNPPKCSPIAPSVSMRNLNTSTIKTIDSTSPSLSSPNPNNLRTNSIISKKAKISDPAETIAARKLVIPVLNPQAQVTSNPIKLETVKAVKPVVSVQKPSPSPPVTSNGTNKANHILNLLKLHSDGKKQCGPQTTSPQLASPIIQRVPGKWEQHVPVICMNDLEVMVQHVNVDDPTIVWVLMVQHNDDCNTLLTNINETIHSSSSVDLEDIDVHQLYAVKYEEIFYRGIVLEKPKSGSKVLFRLVDYGDQVSISLEDIKTPTTEMSSLNSFAFSVRLPRTMATPQIGDTITLNLLEGENGDFVAKDTAVAAPPPVVSVPIVSSRESAPTKVLAPIQVVPKPIVHKAYTMDNIKVIPVPENQPITLYCLDQSEIENGIITASICDYEQLSKLDEIKPAMEQFCNKSKANGFVPQPGQLCLAVFSEDASWYRALCLDEVPNDGASDHTVMFLDYGNTAKVSSDQVRNIPEEFLFPTLANSCLIEGLAEHPNKADIIAAFRRNPVFECKKAEQIHENVYVIQL